MALPFSIHPFSLPQITPSGRRQRGYCDFFQSCFWDGNNGHFECATQELYERVIKVFSISAGNSLCYYLN